MKMLRPLIVLLSLLLCSSAFAANAPNYSDSSGGPHSSQGVFLLGPAGNMPNDQTYSISIASYAAYATPTDLFCLSGSATKTVRIVNGTFAAQSTAAALQTFTLIKRSTADTGGTSTTPTPIPYDSANAAASAVIKLYSAAPTVGTPVGTVAAIVTASSTLTTAPAINLLSTFVPNTNLTSIHSALILRGVAEQLCVNYGGGALTAGFSGNFTLVWTEN